MRKFVLSCVVLLTAALALPLVGVFAQTRTSGVSVGNTFRYTYTLNYNIDNNTQSLMPSVFEALLDQVRAMEWMQMSILDVSGANVTVQSLLHFENGTEQSSINTIDVAAGQGNLTLFLVASNLNQNDPIYLGQDEATINETIMRNYPSGSRQVNRQTVVLDYNVTQDELEGLNMTGFMQRTSEDIYWDRQLGVLIEMSYDMLTQSNTYNASISMKVTLVESNALTVPEFTAIMLAPLVFLASGVAATLYRQKKQNDVFEGD